MRGLGGSLAAVGQGFGRLRTCSGLFLWSWKVGGLPEEELMKECVHSVRTLHHDHVTAVLQDLQKSHQEDLPDRKRK